MRRRFPHQPALEGIRAICLIAILLFHSDFFLAAGGYLGVSTLLRVIDFGGYVNDRSGGAFDRVLRPDGGHYSKSGARALVAEWLGARTLEAAFDRSP